MPNPAQPPFRTAALPQHAKPPALDSAALFGGQDEVLIVHGGEIYRLRRTRQGKLILTK